MGEKIYRNVQELIGKTPLMEATNIEKMLDLKARLLVKLEYLNPAGSVKDRIAKNMILTAEQEGKLKPGATIIEPTSGNTGIGLASIAASKGYKLILTMPETMSVERRNILKAYGAEIVLTEGAKGMTGAIEKAKELAERISGSFLAGQFDNPANPAAHIVSTGPEIWEDTDGNVDVFVAGVGTGGTITGVGGYLKEKKKSVKIGAGFVPTVLNTQIYDEIMPITVEKSFETAKLFAHKEGILVGISSGAALYAAIEQAKREENKGKTIVALLPDSGDRYYSTPLFES